MMESESEADPNSEENINFFPPSLDLLVAAMSTLTVWPQPSFAYSMSELPTADSVWRAAGLGSKGKFLVFNKGRI